ncbi:Transmembrane protein [Phytophthora cinnamomi]|uniref:Transmembrane protein n=1 Tax=Phytophthora cinnamomi TaxID=4785 RepID=UPI003559F423|nr:Transmembrane protein [Phytophthora cinnamomi]
MDPQVHGAHGGTSVPASSSFMPASLPAAGGDYLQRSFTPAESTATAGGDLARANALADRNTIVDMSLRLGRFVLCVVAALAFAFGFALLTANKKTLTYVYENRLAANETLSTQASSVVEDYNTLFGYILFAGGKVFEVFCETLIFPTLATYLHNCSLYPGDQPARVHSAVKARSIFWGLKTVIILMNVGFTSVYVGQTTLEPGVIPSRRLAVSDGLTTTLFQMKPPSLVDAQADVLHSILRTSVTGVTTPFEFEDTCGWSNQDSNQQWGAWADDVDTTSVSFSFPSHAWNAALLSSKTAAPTTAVEVPLRDYLDNHEKYGMSDDWDPAELYSTFQQGVSKLGLARASGDVTLAPQSFDELVHVVASELKTVLPSNTRVGDLVVRLEHRELAEDVRFTSLTLSIPVEADNTGTTRCGASGCVYATSTSVLEKLHMQPGVSIASYDQDANSALVYSAGNQYVQELGTPQAPHEVLTLSMGKLSWQLSPLHIRHDAACADEGDQQCLGLSLPFATGDGVLFVGKDALATQHVTRPVALVTLHPATIPDMTRPEDEVLTSWHRLVSAANDMLVRPSPTTDCTPLVDAYLTHIETNHFYLDGQSSQDVYSAALFYLLQRGVPTSYADLMSRRRLAPSAVMASSSSGSGSGNGTAIATTDIEVNVPTATALVTLAGCIFIVLLMLCVVYIPTSRVKLSPDTTPAAQYVQILTDDLYPDVVHKKRLRFANGDCLLFNEYIVDAIVLYAKRDQTKKIYL